jgi:type II secretory pathway pseudopilin PulG
VRNLVRNDYRVSLRHSSRGIALIVFLAIILVAFTSIAISRLSHRFAEQERDKRTLQVLMQAREAIMGITLAAPSGQIAVLSQPAQPPRPAQPARPVRAARPIGTLPCPDTDGDGLSNPTVGACISQFGLLPFINLDMQLPLDSSGRPIWIWYAVPQNYTDDPIPQFNSSTTSVLNLFLSLQGVNQNAAFILIAPNDPLTGQVRPGGAPALGDAAQFLEGENVVNPPDLYSDLSDNTHNDKVLSMPINEFWGAVEGRVLYEVGNALSAYRTSCGVYPFAASYTAGGNNDSTNGVREGRVPLGTARPSDWGTGCAATIAAPPVQIRANWGDALYYAFCAAPNCLTLFDAVPNNIGSASALIIAPGVPVGTWTSGTRNTFYELQNATSPDNNFTKNTRTGTFNDLIRVLP